jgi:DNA repair exonuclease SbcCD nuclease subunit
MAELIFAADTHLSPVIWRDTPGVCGDAYHALDQIVAYACRQPAAGLVLGGDVFDEQPASTAMAAYNRACDRLAAAGVPLWVIRGQHDRRQLELEPEDDRVGWPCVHAHPVDVDWKLVEALPGVTLYGLEHRGDEALQKALKKIPRKANVLVLHQLIKDQPGWDFDPAWLPESIKLVLMGDLHQPLELCSGGARIVYSGATHPRAIDEPMEHSFLVVRADLTTERVKLQPLRGFRRWVVHSEAQAREAQEKLAACTEGDLVHVRYDPRVGDIPGALRKAAAERVHLRFEPVGLVRLPGGEERQPLEEASLEACLERLLAAVAEDDRRAWMGRLIREGWELPLPAARRELLKNLREEMLGKESG